MSINAVGSGQTGSLDQLVTQLLNTADTNKDGQLSISEFGALFASLLRGMGNGTSSASSAAAATVKAASATPSYAPMAGFDTAKINDALSGKSDTIAADVPPASRALVEPYRAQLQEWVALAWLGL